MLTPFYTVDRGSFLRGQAIVLAGDVEINPGPDSKLLTELKEFRRERR